MIRSHSHEWFFCLGGEDLRRRSPVTIFPNQYAMQWYRDVRRMIARERKQLWEIWKNQIRPLIHEYRRMVGDGYTQDDPMDDVEGIMERFREWAEQEVFSSDLLERVAESLVKGINNHSKQNIQRQVRVLRAIDPTINEDWLRSFMRSAIKENVNWIKSISQEYHDRVETIIYQGVRRGESITEMARSLREVADISEKRAKFIARDQTGSIYGDMTHRRQQKAGIAKFEWSTSGDERVRESHRELDGKVFTWEKGAEVDGRRIWPGTDYNCRCVALPVIEDA